MGWRFTASFCNLATPFHPPFPRTACPPVQPSAPDLKAKGELTEEERERAEELDEEALRR